MINLLRWDQHTRGICELISEVRTCAATAVEAAAHVDGGASLRCLLFTTANIFHLSPSRCLGVPLPDRALASKCEMVFDFWSMLDDTVLIHKNYRTVDNKGVR
jgi:hypothetical protein